MRTKDKNLSGLGAVIRKYYPEYNAVIELIKVALSTNASNGEKIAANKEVAKYCFPQLRAVETKLGIDEASKDFLGEVMRHASKRVDESIS
jgi:hypothetical protein